MTFFPPTFTAIMSQMKRREVAKAKSRTLSATNRQVFVLVALTFSFSTTSSCDTMMTGASKVLSAFLYRWYSVRESTSLGF